MSEQGLEAGLGSCSNSHRWCFQCKKKTLQANRGKKRYQPEVSSANTLVISQITNVVTTAKSKAVGTGGCMERGTKASSCKRGSLWEEKNVRQGIRVLSWSPLTMDLGLQHPTPPQSPFLPHTLAPVPLNGARKIEGSLPLICTGGSKNLQRKQGIQTQNLIEKSSKLKRTRNKEKERHQGTHFSSLACVCQNVMREPRRTWLQAKFPRVESNHGLSSDCYRSQHSCTISQWAQRITREKTGRSRRLAAVCCLGLCWEPRAETRWLRDTEDSKPEQTLNAG